MLTKENIQTIIFDWGGVCCSEGEPFASSVLQKAVGLGPNEIAKEVKDIYLDYYRGKYHAETFWHAVLAHFSLPMNATEFSSQQLTAAYLSSYTVWNDVLDTAKKLSEQYCVGLLSDLTYEMKEQIRSAHNLDTIFPFQMYSCDVGMLKQDGVNIFENMLTQMNATPETTLFIDNSKSKIAVAQEAKLHTMLFETREQFFRDIASLL